MNYFAHAIQFLDRPVFAIATGLPDMLSVIDRSMRLREKNVLPFVNNDDDFRAAVAAGVLQHLADDRWFHGTQAFVETSSELTRMFRNVFTNDDSPRCAFLGHIVTELQLDGALHEAHPGLLNRYYDLLAEVDHARMAADVNAMATKASDRLERLLGGFLKEQFLRDYNDAGRLRIRLNQVMLRVGLEPLPESIEVPLQASWELVRSRVDDLLPTPYFVRPNRFN